MIFPMWVPACYTLGWTHRNFYILANSGLAAFFQAGTPVTGMSQKETGQDNSSSILSLGKWIEGSLPHGQMHAHKHPAVAYKSTHKA